MVKANLPKKPLTTIQATLKTIYLKTNGMKRSTRKSAVFNGIICSQASKLMYLGERMKVKGATLSSGLLNNSTLIKVIVVCSAETGARASGPQLQTI